MKGFIFDYETLSSCALDAPVLSLATLVYDDERFAENPYTYLELVENCQFHKYDINHQVKNLGRVIQTDTLMWWEKQGEDARKVLKPQPDDIIVTSEVMKQHFADAKDCDVIFTRGNTFDPIIVQTLCKFFGQPEPYDWWKIRDTRSYLDGMLAGSGISNKFVPDELKDLFVAHDPRHDIAMDIYRIQHVRRCLEDLE